VPANASHLGAKFEWFASKKKKKNPGIYFDVKTYTRRKRGTIEYNGKWLQGKPKFDGDTVASKKATKLQKKIRLCLLLFFALWFYCYLLGLNIQDPWRKLLGLRAQGVNVGSCGRIV
jgi:hypothetical protein